MSNTRETIVAIIADVAPDADTASLDDQADLRDELDIDSMDLLNVLIGIDEKLTSRSPSATTARSRPWRPWSPMSTRAGSRAQGLPAGAAVSCT